MAYYAIFKGNNGNFHFALLSGNNQLMLFGSTGYSSYVKCKTGLDFVKGANGLAKKGEYEQHTNTLPYYFELKKSDGTLVGKSKEYYNTKRLKDGINRVRKQGVGAKLPKLTIPLETD